MTLIYSLKMISTFSFNLLVTLFSFCSSISIINLSSVNKRFNSLLKRIKLNQTIQIGNDHQFYSALKWRFSGYHFIKKFNLNHRKLSLISNEVFRFEYTGSFSFSISHLERCRELILNDIEYMINTAELTNGIYHYNRSLISLENSIDLSSHSVRFNECVIKRTCQFNFSSCGQVLIENCIFPNSFIRSIPSSCCLILEKVSIDFVLFRSLKKFARTRNLAIINCLIEPNDFDDILEMLTTDYIQEEVIWKLNSSPEEHILYLYFLSEGEQAQDFEGLDDE